MKNVFTFSLVVLLTFGFTQITFGQGFVIQPISIELELDPGESHQQVMTIKNTSGEQKSYNIAAGDWLMDENGTPEYLPANSTPQSCASWITLSHSLIELAPNETKKFNLTFTVPEGDTKARWAVILISASEEQLSAELADQSVVMGGQMIVRIGVPLFQAPSTNDDWNATISGLEKSNEKAKNGKPVYTAVIENKGGRVIKGNIYTTLSNIQTGEEVQLEPFEAVVLPNTKRRIKFQLPDVAKGDYTLTCILDYTDERDYEGTQTEVKIE